ncbi:MAG: DUF374 domain-containing protein [Brachyspira sp.]|nr:DUF374 domain-containing protein [Brachyspira sp.]
MVRLVSKDNLKYLKGIIVGYMQIQKHLTNIVEINNPNKFPCVYAMWHSDQFSIFGVPNHGEVSILISTSNDGDLVAAGCEAIGFRTARGSSNSRGAVEASMQLIERLKDGECVSISVDGPRGPLHKIKNGAIKIAQLSGAPIVPMTWYSEDKMFFTLPSWDKMTAPIGYAEIVNLYGDPIYVPADATSEQIADIKLKLKSSLEDLQKRIPDVYREAKKNKLWKKKKKS